MDENGMILDGLREVLSGLSAEGAMAKFIYTIPNFQNPAGITLSSERRFGLLELANDYDCRSVRTTP